MSKRHVNERLIFITGYTWYTVHSIRLIVTSPINMTPLLRTNCHVTNIRFSCGSLLEEQSSNSFSKTVVQITLKLKQKHTFHYQPTTKQLIVQ